MNGHLLNNTNETLVLENVTSSDAGFYQCEVSLEDEAVLSSISEVDVQGWKKCLHGFHKQIL